MKKIALVILILTAILLSSCTKIENIDNAADVTAITEKTDIETKKQPETTEKEQVTKPEETTEKPETQAPVTTSPEKDGKVTEIKLDKYEVNITVGEKDMPMVTMLPDSAENKKEIWKSDNEKVATVNQYGSIVGVSEGTCTVTVTSDDNKSVKADVKVTVTAKKQVSGCTYIQGILIANKSYSLPADYNPGIDSTANAALQKMFSAAQKEGISLWMASGFRSYQTQENLYNNYVARDGKAEADRYSARAGHSEHQTGLAFDLNSLDQSFGETKEGKWLAANCWKYGFIIRYPKDKENVTGYMYEPWHVRYLGEDTAKKVFDSGKCLEEYLGIDSVYSN